MSCKLRSGLLSVSLACLPLTLGATEFFFDDFESYFDDAELQDFGGWQVVEVNAPDETGSAWTILNPCGRVNPPDALGFPSEGFFLISDSDCSGGADGPGSGRSHDLLSPPVEIEAGPVWIHMDCSAQLNNNGTVIFDVDVSTDGGESWTNVFRRVAPSRGVAPFPTPSNVDGYFGRLDIDASAALEGADEFIFRLRQFEPDDDWWVAIDNVSVDDEAPSTGGAVTIFGTEGFSAGIPDDWTVRSQVEPPNEGNSTWTTGDPCRRSIELFNGGNFPYQDGRGIGRLGTSFAILDSDCDPDPPEDEWLQTPVIDCSEAEAVWLHYSEEIVPTGAVQEVLLSLDGGESFEPDPLFSYGLGGLFDGGEDPFFAERILPAAGAEGESEVVFAFHYSSGGNEWYWAVDDVRVSANGEGLDSNTCANRQFRVAGFDAATGSVSMSWQAAPGDEGFRIVGNGTIVADDLPADASSFVDANPPLGAEITYTLQALAGGEVRIECEAPSITGFTCPSELVCCVDDAAGTVDLRWTNGSNLQATAWRVLRDGDELATIGVELESYRDLSAEEGDHVYSLELVGVNAELCPELPLSCSVTLAGGDVIFSEDFDCYGNDDDLTAGGWRVVDENEPLENATWTVTNPGGRANPPTGSGGPSSGAFVISDSDAAGNSNPTGSGMSHDLWSPSFDCSGREAVWLHLDVSAVLNNNGVCVFDIEVSADGGDSWTNVFRRVGAARNDPAFLPVALTEIPEGFDGGPQLGNADGVYGRLHLDLSDVAAGESEVQFRVRHFEPNDDWWIAFDNVRVDSVPATGGGRALLEEDFEGGIPEDWELLSEGDGFNPWSSEDPCAVSHFLQSGGVFPDAADGRQLHHFGESFALATAADCFGGVGIEELLTTPPVDLSGAETAWLQFRSAQLLTAQPVAEVLLSLDGGETFLPEPIFSYHSGGGFLRNAGNAEVAMNQHLLELPQAAGEAEVSVAFRWLNGGETSWWAIDDVRISVPGDGPGPIFVRGDADGTIDLNITDAVFVLNFLFLGGEAPACRDAADPNDSGDTDITDGIYLLNFLFLGGAPPSAPFPDCGEDPTPDDELDCATPPAC